MYLPGQGIWRNELNDEVAAPGSDDKDPSKDPPSDTLSENARKNQEARARLDAVHVDMWKCAQTTDDPEQRMIHLDAIREIIRSR